MVRLTYWPQVAEVNPGSKEMLLTVLGVIAFFLIITGKTGAKVMNVNQNTDLADAWIKRVRYNLEIHNWEVITNHWFESNGYGTVMLQWTYSGGTDVLPIDYDISDLLYKNLRPGERIGIRVRTDEDSVIALQSKLSQNQNTPEEDEKYYYNFTKISTWSSA